MKNPWGWERKIISDQICDISERMDKEEDENLRQHYRNVIQQLQTKLENI